MRCDVCAADKPSVRSLRRHLLKDHGRSYDGRRGQSVAYRGSSEQLQQAQERQHLDRRNPAARRRQREEAGQYQLSASVRRVSASGQPRRMSMNSETRQLMTGRPAATGAPMATTSSIYRTPTPVIVARKTWDHAPASRPEQSPNTLIPCRQGAMVRSSMISSTCGMARGGIGRLRTRRCCRNQAGRTSRWPKST